MEELRHGFDGRRAATSTGELCVVLVFFFVVLVLVLVVLVLVFFFVQGTLLFWLSMKKQHEGEEGAHYTLEKKTLHGEDGGDVGLETCVHGELRR